MVLSSVLPITMVLRTRTGEPPISWEAAEARGERRSASRNWSCALSGHWHRVLYLK